MAEKPDKIAEKKSNIFKRAEKPSPKEEKNIVKAKEARAKVVKAKERDKDKDKVKKPNFLARWWRETIGELRRVSWPTPKDAWRLTVIVLIVMAAMSALLGSLNLIFSKLVELVLG